MIQEEEVLSLSTWFVHSLVIIWNWNWSTLLSLISSFSLRLPTTIPDFSPRCISSVFDILRVSYRQAVSTRGPRHWKWVREKVHVLGKEAWTFPSPTSTTCCTTSIQAAHTRKQTLISLELHTPICLLPSVLLPSMASRFHAATCLPMVTQSNSTPAYVYNTFKLGRSDLLTRYV